MQAIEFFFFAALIFIVTIIFAIMSFFYKYVDLSGQDDTASRAESPNLGQNHNESSALVSNGGGVTAGQKQPYTASTPPPTESEGESIFDKDVKSREGTQSESEF